MYKKDQIKVIVAIIILLAILLSYFLLGKETAKYVAIGGFAVWLASMFRLNGKK